jgi:lysophospholipase L1-like esterase
MLRRRQGIARSSASGSQHPRKEQGFEGGNKGLSMKLPRATTPHHRCLAVFSIAALALFPPLVHAQLPLQDGDTVCIIGNGLADRMQHDGWVETVIQSELARKKISFRNLAFTGDTVTSRPRSKGFTPPEDYLKHCGADVIFVFFGYNESFGGDKQVEKFKNDLGSMIDKYRGIKFNGETTPRFVLFSPIAHEDHGTPLLPNGNSSNVNLALYTGAIRQVADDKSVGFVDLFSSTQSLYGRADQPLTLNGVHLLPEGNRQLAEVIASAIVGKEVKAPRHWNRCGRQCSTRTGTGTTATVRPTATTSGADARG